MYQILVRRFSVSFRIRNDHYKLFVYVIYLHYFIGTNGREDLPGEHGFRIVFGFYKHLVNTMQRIPFDSSSSVYDQLEDIETIGMWQVIDYNNLLSFLILNFFLIVITFYDKKIIEIEFRNFLRIFHFDY